MSSALRATLPHTERSDAIAACPDERCSVPLDERCSADSSGAATGARNVLTEVSGVLTGSPRGGGARCGSVLGIRCSVFGGGARCDSALGATRLARRSVPIGGDFISGQRAAGTACDG